MLFRLGRWLGLIAVLCAALSLSACGGLLPKTSAQRAYQPLKQSAYDRLKAIGSSPGAGMLIRVFKKSNEFEVWKQTAAGDYKLFNTYTICAWSGELGPKIKEGDRQAPEGFYNITPALMNPNSNYYLSFNTGFPNKFDRAWGRTGANLMVHGDCSSAGCYSMTDESVAEIYALARETFKGGNSVIQMQIFPFRMTPGNLALYAGNPNMPFWMNIKEGYDRFELTHRPPTWDVCEKKYVFDLQPPGSGVLDAAATCPPRQGDTLLASLKVKQDADNAAFKTEVAAIADRQAAAAAEEQKAADAEAAAKARGAAIGGFMSGVTAGIAGWFGGNGGEQPAPIGSVAPVVPAVAPVPAPRIDRG
jgi:murein L,D-transpeptidase YafK